MNRVLAALSSLLFLGSLAHAANLPSPATPSSAATVASSPLATGADYAVVDVGSQAPDFSYESPSGWLHLHDLRLQGHVLLVIAPDERTLLALQRERTALHRISVVPVAVLERKSNATRALVNRLHLDYPVLPDPRGVIGEQFNALDPSSRAEVATWFVLDQGGRVHDLGRQGWPDRPWLEVSARSLGVELPHVIAPAAYGER